MTIEEAARILKADDVEWNEIFDSESGLLEEALDIAIRSLEAWEKVRAEIEEHAKINQNSNIDRARALCWCLNVIDKYTAESEVSE